ncbi:DVU_1553 family AMP-dependent CoA ligase [Desulforamulus aeronauticus]|uniref:Phenylacetate-coenzyme A ligase PaaK, adenylate-forming domain family n=1 Tax=Desulforamulus aeronauticus DSM 10349 TaxID=1121421 RepID=A0A1M6S0R9_9FIRM|nr:AMP-binding protein [Desulforamulus aeronauticus]SHK38412.1 Phenylacetate-coenzyme A ligase PaaK, adenylate-forming domain family [Desulforamulus aeronauticus DSM 10349]
MKITPLQNWLAHKLGVSGSSLNRETLEQYQLQKLRQTMELAVQHSSFYRKKLGGRGTLANLASLKDLPFTTAADIRQNPLRFLCVSQDEISRVVTLTSSGTTGEPKRLYFTKQDQELTIDFFQIGMSTLVGPGDTVLILLPGQLPGSVGDLLAQGLARLGVRAIPHGLLTDPNQTRQIILEQGVNALVGIPTQVLALARYPLPLKSVLLSADYVPRAISRELAQSWGCQVFSHYGMTEMGLGGGVECAALAGYHLREADLYFEIINPDTGQVVPEGETGEVVFTTLTRRGMPLIRYRTGDLARFIPEPCPCGSMLRRMGQVKGRVAGTCQLAGGRLRLWELDEALFPVTGLLNFTVTLSRTNHRDRLTIVVQMADGMNGSMQEVVRAALDTVPTIQRATRQGSLEICLEILPRGGALQSTTAKRLIKHL